METFFWVLLALFARDVLIGIAEATAKSKKSKEPRKSFQERLKEKMND